MSHEPETKPDGENRKEPAKLSFSVPQLAGSAAAAATVAYVGSSLGTAGTIFGAALASVIGAVAGTVYTAGLDRTGRRLGNVMQRGWTRIRQADPELDEDLEPAAEAGGSPSGDAEPPHDKGRTWRRVALRTLTAAAAIFAVSFVAITGWELANGQALDGGEGTTVGQVVRPERTPTAEPEPTPSEPTVSETPTPEVTPTTPTPTTPTPEPSESEIPEPSPTPSETVEPIPTPTPASASEVPDPAPATQP